MPAFQIDGLATGLQTGQIIDQMMQVESQPITRLQTKVAVYNQRQKAFTDVRTQFQSLQSALSAMMRPTTLNTKTASVSSVGAGGITLSAKAGLDAALGSFRVYVDQLATATTATAAGRSGQAVDATVALESAGFITAPSTTVSGSTSGAFTINGASVSVDSATDSLNDVIARINSQVAGVTATLVDANGNASASGNYVRLTSNATISLGSGADTSNFLTVTNLLAAQPKGATATGAPVASDALAAGELHIDGVIVTTRATATGNTAAQNAASLAADINNTAGIKVVASVNNDGSLNLTSKTRGVGASISITQATAASGLSTGTTTQATQDVASAAGVGGVNITEPLASSRLSTAISGLDVNGNGEFTVNGVSIAYSQADSLGEVLSRISASTAGVIATYDSALDRVLFSAKTTGSLSIAFQDVTGNLLSAAGASTATQSLGKNALFRISTLNGGVQQSSTSNTVSNVVAGVELNLQQESTSPVDVAIGQSTQGAVQAVQGFVDSYNATMSMLRDRIKIDPKGQTTGVLNNDGTLQSLEAGIRTYLVSKATGLTGAYQSLSDAGITFGAVGSAVGSTSNLQLDQSKLTKALQSSPQTVYDLLSGYQATATLQPGGTGGVASISGAPSKNHQAGAYAIKTFVGGSISAAFTPTGGVLGDTVFGSALTPGGTDSVAVPGIVFTATNPLVTGTHMVTVAVQTKGVLVGLSDFMESVVNPGGLLTTRADSASKAADDLNRQITSAQARVDEKRKRLEAQFAQLESLMSQMKSQQSALSAQLAQFSK